MKKITLILFVFLLSAVFSASFATIYYVAPTGLNTNNGSIAQPFLTIQKAQDAVVAGDTVYVRGGTYMMDVTQVATYTGIWAYVTYLTKSGTSGKRINYWAYPGEKPIFNYTNIAPAGYRINAFQVNASWIYIKGLEITGVQVTILTHTQSECFENQGSNNIYEMLTMHDGKAIGFYLTKGGNNLILNCDAYNNYDNVSETQTGGNTDGFGFHPNKDGVGYTNNIFRGCRAWFNSDDGYDCINSFEAVIFENCWAFYNGYSTSFGSLGDGNGFKAGGYGVTDFSNLPAIIPRNTIRFCLAVRNKANGFYANHHLGGNNWYNNSAYMNASNFNMLNRSADYLTDVPGYDHNLKNNLSFNARSTDYSNINFTTSNADTNSFNLPVTVNSADFVSIDQALLIAPRQADGSLPNNNFMRLVATSDLIDKGLNVGLAYNGAAPDLGCFESIYNTLPVNLVYFNAAAKNNSVVLNWQVAAQLNNKGWDIERAEGKPELWQKIGFVDGNGTLAEEKTFSFTDTKVATGVYYYRLKQADADGHFAYSPVQTVKFTREAMLSAYPFSAGAMVQYTIPAKANVQLTLYNETGALLGSFVNKEQPAGMYQQAVDEKFLKLPGAYIIQLSMNEQRVSRVFVK